MADEGRDVDEVRQMWDAWHRAGGAMKEGRLEEALELLEAIR